LGIGLRETEEEGLENIDGPQSVPIEMLITLFGKGTMYGERVVLVKHRQGPAMPRDVDTEEEYLTWSNENGLQQGLRE
jgi:hypothetical protein